MKRGQLKSIAFFLLKLAGTVFFLWWALSSIEDKGQLLDNFHLAAKNPAWLAGGFGFALIAICSEALRWYFLLRAQGIREKYSYILRLTFYAAFFNIASLGGAAGDASKIFLLIRRHPEKKTGIAISVMIDHVIGFLASGVIFLSFTWFFGVINLAELAADRRVFTIASWFQAAAMIGLLFSVLSCHPYLIAKGRIWFPKITNNKYVEMVTAAIDLHRTGWRHGIMALFASFSLALAYYLSFYAGLRALGEDISAITMMSVMPVVDVIAALPISISGLGVREQTFDYLLGKLSGVDTASAVAGSLLGFVFTASWGIIGGLAIITARTNKVEKGNDAE